VGREREGVQLEQKLVSIEAAKTAERERRSRVSKPGRDAKPNPYHYTRSSRTSNPQTHKPQGPADLLARESPASNFLCVLYAG